MPDSGPRTYVLYCLHSQAGPSLMVQEKQMPLLAALVFLLDSLYHELKVWTMYCKHSVKFFKKNIKRKFFYFNLKLFNVILNSFEALLNTLEGA